jgi:hypothetical protein
MGLEARQTLLKKTRFNNGARSRITEQWHTILGLGEDEYKHKFV